MFTGGVSWILLLFVGIVEPQFVRSATGSASAPTWPTAPAVGDLVVVIFTSISGSPFVNGCSTPGFNDLPTISVSGVRVCGSSSVFLLYPSSSHHFSFFPKVAMSYSLTTSATSLVPSPSGCGLGCTWRLLQFTCASAFLQSSFTVVANDVVGTASLTGLSTPSILVMGGTSSCGDMFYSPALELEVSDSGYRTGTLAGESESCGPVVCTNGLGFIVAAWSVAGCFVAPTSSPTAAPTAPPTAAPTAPPTLAPPPPACGSLQNCQCSGSVCVAEGNQVVSLLVVNGTLTIKGNLTLQSGAVAVIDPTSTLIVQEQISLSGTLVVPLGSVMNASVVVVTAQTIVGEFTAVVAESTSPCVDAISATPQYGAQTVLLNIQSVNTCNTEGASLSTGAIVGIAVGVIFAGVLLGLIVVCIVHRQKSAYTDASNAQLRDRELEDLKMNRSPR